MEEKQDKSLLEQYYTGTIEPAEKELLFQWLGNPENRSRFSDIAGQLMLSGADRVGYSAAEWEHVLQMVLTTDKPGVKSSRIQPVAALTHFLRRGFVKYAAAVLIVCGIGAYFWKADVPQKAPVTKNLAKPDVPAPLVAKAMITLGDGRKINLDNAPTGVLATEGAMSIEKLEDGRIIYHGLSSEKMIYNTISVPRGSKIASLTLADGTLVYLNTASTLKYPVAFSSNQRKVEITGEGYFEVAKDRQKPFIVSTARESITVLGTKFNVNAYPDEQGVKTSLLEGSIKVGEQFLKPGQAFLNGQVMNTDPDMDIAWKKGIFQFDHSAIDDVMRQISRWYDVEVIYKSKVPVVLFSGKMKKELNLDHVIRILNNMQVVCELKEGNKIVVY